MKNSDHRVIWALVGLMTASVVLLIMLAKPAVNWYTQFELNDDHPYGVSFIHDLLEADYSKDHFTTIEEPFFKVYEDLNPSAAYTYAFVGNNREYGPEEISALYEFVGLGNNCLIASAADELPLIDTLLAHSCREYRSRSFFDEEGYSNDGEEQDSIIDILKEYSFEEDDWLERDGKVKFSWDTSGSWKTFYTDSYYSEKVTTNFYDVALCSDSGYTFYRFNNLDTTHSHWNYFDDECIEKAQVIGFTEGRHANYIRVPYGKGYFYFHSNPQFFTNVELLDSSRLQYAENAFSYVAQENFLWDNYSPKIRQNWDLNQGDSENPLSYLLSEPPLRWSLYLIVAGALLYVLFRAKRRRQFIPVIEPNTNTSLEYVEMMGQLYFEQKDNRFVATQLWKQFVDYIRSHYYISAEEMKSDWLNKLAVKSRISENRIRGIERAYTKTESEAYGEADLINFYDKLKYFYSNCK